MGTGRYIVTYNVRKRGAIGVSTNTASVAVAGRAGGISAPHRSRSHDPDYEARVALVEAAGDAFFIEHGSTWERVSIRGWREIE